MHLNGFLCNIAFVEYGEALLDADEQAFDVQGARELLARAPWSNKAGLRLYGEILSKLLDATALEEDPENHEIDGTLLSDYWHGFCLAPDKSKYPNEESEFAAQAVHAMEEYADGDPHRQGLEFIRVYMRVFLQKQSEPAHRLFATVESHPTMPVLASLLSIENGSSHPALRWAVMHDRIDLAAICTELETASVNPSTYLWQTMGPFVVQNEWLPGTPALCARLWYAHVKASMGIQRSILTEPTFVEAMLKNTAFSPNHAMECLLNSYDVPESTVVAFFPIPFARCNSGVVLSNLVVQLATVNDGFRKGIQKAFLPQLRLHHQDLWDALQLHFAVAQTVEIAQDTASALAPVFDRIRLGISETKLDDIDAGVFE